MQKYSYKLNNSVLFFEVKTDKKSIVKFSVPWFYEGGKSHIFRDTLKKINEMVGQIANYKDLEYHATKLDRYIDQAFIIFRSRPEDTVSEFDRYFDKKVKLALSTLEKGVSSNFQVVVTEVGNFLLQDIFLCIVEAISEVADIYLNDNRIQNKLRMQRIANKENPYGELPEFDSEMMEDDVVLQTINVANMLSRLTPLQKKRVMQYFFEGFTYEEIAKQENVDYRAIYKSIARALKTMSKGNAD